MASGNYRPRHAKLELAWPGPLARGARDAGKVKDVHRIQEWCSLNGFATAIDGQYGPATQMSLQQFQEERLLPVTGVLDEESWAELVRPMSEALGPVPVGDTETLYDVALRVSGRHLLQRPVEVGGDNMGPWVRLYMDGLDGKDQLWCAGFCCFVLSQTNSAMGGQGCPIPRQVGVDALVADAKRSHRFIAQAEVSTATARKSKIKPGSLFVIRNASNPNDWIHTGFVAEVDGDTFSSIEGNTNESGGRNGYQVATRRRGFARTDFISL